MIFSHLPSNARNVVFLPEGIFVKATLGISGAMLFGPYVSMPKGHFSVQWRVILRDPRQEWDESRPALTFDVVSDSGRNILARKTLALSEVREQSGNITIEFDVPAGGAEKVEFRAFSLGLGEFLLETNPRLRDNTNELVFPDTRLFERIESGADESDVRNFVADNLSDVLKLRKMGATLSMTQSGIRASFENVEVLIKNRQDFKIFREVFYWRIYVAEFPERFVVADVGMNVGFASLMFASLSGAAEVHSFEPFAYPFERALENFALNPSLGQKIKPHNFGLYDKTTSYEVGYNADNSIATSVRGEPGSSRKVTIELQEAVTVLAPIIADAHNRGLRFLLKLDCEGSEFPIIENLYKQNLLKEVDCILMEWHKWWDKSKTGRDLIEPLIASGFIILDRTRDEDIAGFMSAVQLTGSSRLLKSSH